MIQITANSYEHILTSLILCLAFSANLFAQSDQWGDSQADSVIEAGEADFFSPEELIPAEQPTSAAALNTNFPSMHAGLLGKSYFHVSYTNQSYQHYWLDERLHVHGLAIEGNNPIERFRREKFGTDFFARFEYSSIEASRSSRNASLFTVGLRSYWLLDNKNYRPYASVGVGMANHGGTSSYGWKYSYSNARIISSLGIEADLSSQVAMRHELDAYINGGGLVYDGSLIFWAGKKTFFRGGVEVPFSGGNSRFSIGIGRSR